MPALTLILAVFFCVGIRPSWMIIDNNNNYSSNSITTTTAATVRGHTETVSWHFWPMTNLLTMAQCALRSREKDWNEEKNQSLRHPQRHRRSQIAHTTSIYTYTYIYINGISIYHDLYWRRCRSQRLVCLSSPSSIVKLALWHTL